MPGYEGELCETRISNSCLESPCKNGGACQPFGSLGYICICPSGCGGYNCTECDTSVPLPSSSTRSPTTPSLTSPIVTDYNQASCQYYKSLNLCEQDSFIGSLPIKVACAATCNSFASITTVATTQRSTTTSTTHKPTTLITNRTTQNINTQSYYTDFNPSVCAYYKTLGLCTQGGFIGSMPINQACGSSCNDLVTSTTTKSTTSSNCFDIYQQQCLIWKDFCLILNGLSDHPCKKTCSIC